MATLIMLRGNSGSGKTTLAHRIQHELGRGTLVISQDVVRRDMLYAKDGPGTPALGLLRHLAEYGSSHCEFVILEGILTAETYRPLFELCRRKFDRIFAYYYDIPFEETLRRHATRAKSEEFGEAEMRSWWITKDFIGDIPEKPLTEGLSQAEVLQLILTDIQK